MFSFFKKKFLSYFAISILQMLSNLFHIYILKTISPNIHVFVPLHLSITDIIIDNIDRGCVQPLNEHPTSFFFIISLGLKKGVFL